jgi:hypothetical protein
MRTFPLYIKASFYANIFRSVIRANLIENMWTLVYTMADLNISFAQVSVSQTYKIELGSKGRLFSM